MGLTLPTGRIKDLDTPDAHITFVRSQWCDFAAFAWKNFLSEGRGAVIIDLRNTSKSGGGLHVPTYYVAAGSERLATHGGWPNEEIADLVKEYDPEQDVVLIFLRLDGDAFYYNVSNDLTPPRAYETRRVPTKGAGDGSRSNKPLTSD